MSHVAFQDGAREIALDVDYAVIGSGAGGATAAVTLARAGREVAVIEAGPWRDPHDYPSSVYGAMRDMMEDWGSTFTRGRAFWPVVQGALVGGSTAINSAICVRTPGDVFERWQRERGVGGEAMARAVWEAEDALEHELGAEPPAEGALGRSNLFAMRASRALGFEGHYLKRYANGCTGSGNCLQGCKQGKKQSLNVRFVPEVLARGGHVLSCAPADRVVFEGGRAIGVRGRFKHPVTRKRGAGYFVRARRGVLVAASVTHSALLLKRSGLRARALGRQFQAHPGLPLFGLYDDAIDMNAGATQGWGSYAFREEPGFKLETLSLPLDMFAGRAAGGGALLMQRLTEFRKLAMWVQACRAESVGTIEPGPFGKPVVRYSLNRADMERVRAAFVVLARMHFACGARAVLPGIHGLPYSLGPGELHVLEQAPLDPRAYVAILSHLFGGCAMGRDAATSVCDEYGAVHGVEGLHVVDASVMPTNIGVNPQHTIMGLAAVFAQRLVAA